jgi:hypothetical protein
MTSEPEIAGRLNRRTVSWSRSRPRCSRAVTWGDGGFRSPEHYLVVRAGLSAAQARDVVAVARRGAELPAVKEDKDALVLGRAAAGDPEAAYEPPSGEAARWHDIKIPPDAERGSVLGQSCGPPAT